MSDQDQQTQQDDAAAFEAGFDSVRNAPDDFASPEAKEPEAPDAPDQQEPAEPEPEKPVLAGLTESQIKSLLERSAKVDAIEDQLRKAHGKIGELNGKLQEIAHPKQPTQSAPAAPVDDEELAAVERDYPEFAKLAEARARKIAAEMLQGHTPTAQGPSADDIRAEVGRDLQMALMDTLHDGWRDTVNSQDFALWIATQPADIQQRYATTESAKELAGILTSFKTAKDATQDRSARNKQRLEAALTPSGAASKTQHAPSAEDEFAAGFYSVRPKR